jgi:hypothetical protein
MPRPTARMEPMLELLALAWKRYPDQRLGQLIGNAARDRSRPTGLIGEDSETGAAFFATNYRDPFDVGDDEIWEGLRELAYGGYDPGPFGPEENPLAD